MHRSRNFRIHRAAIYFQISDSAYGSLATSQYHRSSSSKSPSSNLSKSSTSGSSGFGCYNTEGKAKTTSAQLPPASSSSLSTVKKKEPKHKKSKSKSALTATAVPGGAPKGEEGQGQRSTSHTLTSDDKASKVAVLSQALELIDKFRKSQDSKEDKTGGPDEAEINDLATNLQEASQGASTKSNKSFPFGGGTVEATKFQITEVLDKEQSSTAVGGFCAAVSLNDGMVMQTTTTITAVLGFPKDMWHGRSFIDFVHPKDRITFTNKITSTVMLPFGGQGKVSNAPGPPGGGVVDGGASNGSLSGGNFFCRLRMYNSLKQGKFSIRARKTVYTPFKLRVDFREIGAACSGAGSLGGSDEGSRSPADSHGVEPEAGLQSVCLIITAVPLTTAYTEAEQVNPFGATFMTRHTSNCVYSKVSRLKM